MDPCLRRDDSEESANGSEEQASQRPLYENLSGALLMRRIIYQFSPKMRI